MRLNPPTAESHDRLDALSSPAACFDRLESPKRTYAEVISSRGGVVCEGTESSRSLRCPIIRVKPRADRTPSAWI